MDKNFKTNLKLVAEKNKKKFPSFKQFKYINSFLNSKEKIVLKIFILLFLVSAGYFLIRGYQKIPSTPTYGGSYTEGIIGQIQYLNPILSSSNSVDTDINKLIYNSLFEYKNRILSPSLVETYNISDDKRTYTFKLRNGIKWHDGVDLTSDDVIFTINTAKNPNYKSPLYVSLKDIKVEKIDDLSFKITLNEPYSPFLSYLTFGILPKHIWQDITYLQFSLSEFNLKPVGTGPYKFKTLSKSRDGHVQSYTLESNSNYFESKPYIKDITFTFLSDTQDAIDTIKDKKIDGVSYLMKENIEELQSKSIRVNKLELPQYTALFFNSSLNSLLKEEYIREILTLGTNTDEIIEKALNGNAEKVETIFFENMLGYNTEFSNYVFNPTDAIELLADNGWKRNSETGIMEKNDKPLEFTLTVVNNKNNQVIADLIKEQWNKLGIKLNIQYVDSSSVKEDIIKLRNYEILLYGEIVSGSSDPYAFWHSSQTMNPGLNLSLYTNKTVDSLIEEARSISDTEKIQTIYEKISAQIKQDIPAIFLYNQYYNYITTKSVNIVTDELLTTPSDRFNDVENWYVKTKKKLF